jgi:hypothetical protein
MTSRVELLAADGALEAAPQVTPPTRVTPAPTWRPECFALADNRGLLSTRVPTLVEL